MISAKEMNEQARNYSYEPLILREREELEKAIRKAAKGGKFSINVEHLYLANITYFEENGFDVHIEKSWLILLPDEWVISWRDKV